MIRNHFSRQPDRWTCLILLATVALFWASPAWGAKTSYQQRIQADQPIAWWRMTQGETGLVIDASAAPEDGPSFHAVAVGNPQLGDPGPTGEEFPDFAPENVALRLSSGGNYLRVSDPGADSPLDFSNGDAITIEAWIRPRIKGGKGYWYIVGKGRTLNPGVGDRNQNYSLRLDARGSSGRLSFFFVDGETSNTSGRNADGHRWTSNDEVALDGRWYHVAITYVFGQPDSIRGYIDGQPTDGRWDLAGPTTKRPIVDDDELWIGASMAGRGTFEGSLDEVAIYRRALDAEEIGHHVRIHRRDEILATVRSIAASAPTDHVQYDVFTSVPDARSWNFAPAERSAVYESDVFALTELPRAYDTRGIIIDRPTPLLVHGYARLTLPAGEYKIALRSLNAARLYVDDQLLAENPFLPNAANGHGKVYQLPPPPSDRLSLAAGHHEKLVPFESDGRPHLFSIMAIAGLNGRPAELGELVVAYAAPGEPFRLLGTTNPTDVATLTATSTSDVRRHRLLTDEGWVEFLNLDLARRRHTEAQARAELTEDEDVYWYRRHQWARDVVNGRQRRSPPEVNSPDRVTSDVDRFLEQYLEQQSVTPPSVIDDLAFLRRVSLDVVGVIPTPAEIETFLARPARTRRENAVARLLDDPRWADHWVGYWQHVLAENPGLTKPTLNNSGPFRWFLYEAFFDNKPFDRLVTELLSMSGGKQAGGPAGFAVATNNDVAMAQKAHIVGTAFLGVEMKCARCHDAPTHESVQRDLFSLAAMLARKPLKVPASSSVPASPEQLAHMAVTVSLKPGSSVPPEWPFAKWFDGSPDDVLTDLIRDPDDSREKLALAVTHPANRRFAEVIVNRIWRRYFGWGFVEPIHDWEMGEPSHPELLDYLADELVLSGYNLKHVASMILQSTAYQRHVAADVDDARRRVAPVRRRLTAEQLADCIFLAVGKPFDSEELCVNPDGRQPAKSFYNLGTPRRAWEFACPSNERERPSMTLPRAQSVVDLMMAFGWRQNRQEPVNERIVDVTPLAPLVLANGVAVSRAIDLADHGQLVELCLADQSVELLVERLYQRFLTRSPTAEELDRFVELLSEGYEERRTGKPRTIRRVDRSPLSWANNLDAEANRIGEQRQRDALKGDMPTRRLTDDWRERVEDTVWVLINSPEFLFVP